MSPTLPSEPDRSLIPVFAALGDPTRAAIVLRLASEDGLTLTRLAREAPITRQAISRHVAVLADAGLLTARRHGREVRLSLEPRTLGHAGAWLARISAAWDSALERLADQVETKADTTAD